MSIWVDADACPVVIKDILYRAAKRTETMTTLVANQPLRVPKSPFIAFILVGAGLDVADNEIVKEMQLGDLIITNDIPLAAEVVEKGGIALSPRGELFTEDNIRSRLSVRDFLENLRGSGVITGGPPALNQKDRQEFGNQLDKWLVKQAKKRS